ncbi:tyrosine-type recombinase/integrase [Saccharopolyspora taberi]|uniref:Tyrosine-type recombinase/integrase n=1 Tax=Saccharopolyspora taberi TaxID=60895 RepID=A0ABN3V5M6_9PSEU
MPRSFDVRIWSIAQRKNQQGKVTSYGIRWRVGAKRFYESCKTRAQADRFRAELIAAQNRGEAFDAESGKPISASGTVRETTWFEIACDYVDMKWEAASATARQTIAEALIRITPVFLPNGPGKPDERAIRSALRGYAFNTRTRAGHVPDEAGAVLRWCARNSRPVSDALHPQTLRVLEKAVTTTLSGSKYAPSVARKTRSVLSSVLAYAVEREALEKNPLDTAKWTTMPKGNRTIDPRTVPNPAQARALLTAVRGIRRSGPRLEAFFGAMYFAGLRPEEAVALRRRDLVLPDSGWGEIYVDEAHPHAGKHWTGTDRARETRGVKARDAGEGRPVPCPPELVDLFRRHLAAFPEGGDRVFVGDRGQDVPKITYMRVWREARVAAFTEEVRVSRLARRPYSLRHAAVSTWLAAGVDPAVVARWAGHSVAVLMDVYAACLHGRDVIARGQVDRFFGYGR